MLPFGLSWGREDIFITGWGDSPASHPVEGQAPGHTVGGMSCQK